VAGGEQTGTASFAVRLPYDVSAARTARRLVADLLSGFDPSPELVGDATLVVHELVINGLTHGAPDERDEIEVTGRVSGGQLVITVRDHGRDGEVAPRPFTPDQASGRGLSMVAMLSSSWTVDRSSGTCVSAWLRL
jgi:anti-sigma regulatory factor (Ser/Thr protein kinase)